MEDIYTQTDVIDYEETFAPNININSVQILLYIVAYSGYELHLFDVKNMLFHVNLEEKVYMDISPNFRTTGGDNKMCRLKKIIWTKEMPTTMVWKIHKGNIVFEL